MCWWLHWFPATVTSELPIEQTVYIYRCHNRTVAVLGMSREGPAQLLYFEPSLLAEAAPFAESCYCMQVRQGSTQRYSHQSCSPCCAQIDIEIDFICMLKPPKSSPGHCKILGWAAHTAAQPMQPRHRHWYGTCPVSSECSCFSAYSLLAVCRSPQNYALVRRLENFFSELGL